MEQQQQAEQTKVESPKAMSKPLASEDEELEQLQGPRSFFDKLNVLAEKFASNGFGQYVFNRTDRMLKMVEDTAKWSVPQECNDVKLERPLPWLPFLFMIVMLRFTRFHMCVLARLLGNRKVTPQDMVSFIQSRRRKIRAIRMHGLREMGRREAEASSTKMDNSLVGKLRCLLSRAICRPGQMAYETPRRVVVYQGKIANQQSSSGVSADKERSASKRPRDDDSADLNMTIEQMLNKYGNDNSDDDSDYVPNAEESNDDSTSSNSSSSSADEIDDEELDDLAKDKMDAAKPVEKPATEDAKIIEVTKLNGVGVREPTSAMPKPMLEIKKESAEHEHGSKTGSSLNNNNNAGAGKPMKLNGPHNGGVLTDMGNGY